MAEIDHVSEDSSSVEKKTATEAATTELTKDPTVVHDIVLGQVEELAEKLGEDQGGIAPVGDVEHVLDKVDQLTIDESRQYLKQLLDESDHDYNFNASQRQKIEALLLGPQEGQQEDVWELQLKTEAAICKFYSPYPEVRAITTPHDDPNMSCETIRAHLLGYIWAAVIQFVNSLFNARFPTVTVTSAVSQILLYPCGLFLALVLPDWGFTAFGRRISINPGPWTYKEQMLATIIINVSVTSAYCFWTIQVQEIFYKQTLNAEFKILILLSTQCLGLGLAGLMRRLAVYPTWAIWPNILPTIALNQALLAGEKKETLSGWTMSRYKFFFISFFGMFFYFFLPGYIMPFLSLFGWMTWISPDNFNLATVTGTQFGVALNPIASFDWNVFGTTLGMVPLAVPFFAYAQNYFGIFLGALAILGVYFSNSKWTGYLPPNSSGLFDNTGSTYNITRVVQNGVLNEDAYKAYSPPFQSAGKLVSYGAFFMYYPLTMTFVLLEAWRPLYKGVSFAARSAYLQIRRVVSSLKGAAVSLSKLRFRECGSYLYNMMNDQTSVYDGFDDPLTNLMRKYPEVPDWWFLAVFVIAFVFGIIVLAQFEGLLSAPIWTIFFVVGINLVFLIPQTVIWAMSGTIEGLNVLTEVIMGYALPGHPLANMMIKAYGYIIGGQADNYLSDQKLGMYAKIPPRAMFRGQMISAVLTALVAYGVVTFVDDDIPGVCTPDQPARFTCANGSVVVYAATVLFGAIGPKRLFDQLYPELQWLFLAGFILALVWWTVKQFGHHVRSWSEAHLPSSIHAPLDTVLYTPISWLQWVHPSLLCNGFLFWAPQNLAYFTGGLYFSIAFMWYLRRYKTSWWEKYNYVLAAGLGGGVAFSAVIIFFALQYKQVDLDWWGVNILSQGVDGGQGQQALITQLPDAGFFGPSTWY